MSNSEHLPAKSDELLKLASEIVSAYVSNNPVPVGVKQTVGDLAHD